MNTVIIFGVFLVACQLSQAKKDVSSIFLFSSQGDNTCQTPGLQCKDCESIQYCLANQEALFQINCKDQNKLRPFCDSATNTCVKTQPAVCQVGESTFVCPGPGIFPDLENCKKYYVCDEDKVALNYACSVGFIYDHVTKGCSKGFSCKSYSSKTGLCKGKINKLIAYAPSKDLYILCLSGKPSLLFQCPLKGDIFNEEEVACKFECTTNGYFTYHPDPTKFYSCIQIGKKFTLSLLNCPQGTEFVEIGPGQGICTYQSTTTTTTEAIQTTTPEEENVDEGSGEAPEKTPEGTHGETEPEIIPPEEENPESELNLDDILTHIIGPKKISNNDDISNESNVDSKSDDASVESVENSKEMLKF